MSVRLLTLDDAAEYRALRHAALRERPPAFGALAEDEPDLKAMMLRLTPTADRCFFGAFDGERLAGILRLSRYAAANEKHRMYLAGFYVDAALRARGYGTSLLRAAIGRAIADPSIRRINLNVVTQQLAAIRLYEKAGFQVCGLEQDAFLCDATFYDEQLMTLVIARAGPCGTN